MKKFVRDSEVSGLSRSGTAGCECISYIIPLMFAGEAGLLQSISSSLSLSLSRNLMFGCAVMSGKIFKEIWDTIKAHISDHLIFVDFRYVLEGDL